MMASSVLAVDSRSSRNEPGASINIKRLQCPHPVIAPNVWTLAKEQPAYLDINIDLKQEFQSAASADALDESTIHYGQLAKRIRCACGAGLNALSVVSKADEVITEMGLKSNDKFIIADSIIELILPKASMHGEELKLQLSQKFDGRREVVATRMTLEFQQLKFMGLIGVNDYERTAKQPIDATLTVTIRPEDIYTTTGKAMDRLTTLCTLERMLAEVVQESSYETLESLADVATKVLIEMLAREKFHDVQVALRLEKPKAIAFADAAVVELRRSSVGMKQAQISATQATRRSTPKKLNVVKPYV